MIRTLLAALFVVTLFAGCDQQALIDKLVPKEEVELAKDVIAQVAAREFDAVEKQLEPTLQGPQTRAKLEEMAAHIPAGEPKSVTTVGAFVSTNGDTKRYNLSFEYEYAASWMTANVVLQRQGNAVYILGANVNPMQQSLKETNRFTFEGKGAVHYVMFVLAVFVPLFTLYAVVRCIMSPIPRRKWLWVAFAALGLVRFSLDWTTGQLNVQTLSIYLFGSGFGRVGDYGPWILSVSIPVGAVVFLLRRRSLVQQQIEEDRAPAEDAA